MPKYVLPKPKKDDSEDMPVVPDDYARTIYIPSNKAIIDALEMGKVAEVTLKGKVVGLEAREGEDYSSHEFRLKLTSVEAYTENEFSELADD